MFLYCKRNSSRKTKKKAAGRLTGLMAMALSAGLFLSSGLFAASGLQVQAATRDEIIAGQKAKTIETNQITNWPQGPVITADSAILMDAQTGAILYAKDIHKQQYPASTTKLLTTLIASETCSMDEIVTFSYKAVHDNPYDGSHIAIDTDEQLTMEQCLSAILIASANEVSFAVAEHIAGTTWEDFVPLMNQRAQELGCLNTNFVNPNGLHHDEHVTTAYDLAMIGQAFFANELLCKFASTRLLHIPPTEHQPDDIYAANTNKLLKGQEYAYEYFVAGKTGYTDNARSCLVTCAEKDGLRLICVVLHDYSPAQYQDTIALFDYGFANFSRVNVSQTETKYNMDSSNFFYSKNDIFGSSKPILALNTQDCITLPKSVDFSQVQSTISYDTQEEGQVAVITYSYQDQYLGSASVDLARDTAYSYSFESVLADTENDSSAEAKEPEKDNVIFVNIIKVVLWILGIAAAIVVLFFGAVFIRNYHFAMSRRNNRRNWKRRRRRNSYNTYSSYGSLGRNISPAARRRRRARRPSRFRDFDF